MSFIRLDGWKNFLTGLGKFADKSEATRIGGLTLLDDITLSSIYMADGLGKKIVTSVAEDLISNGFTVMGDTQGQLKEVLRNLNVIPNIHSAIKWSRLFGGSLMVLSFDDGLPLDRPLLNKNASVRGIKVYPRSRVTFGVNDYSRDEIDEVERFQITKLNNPSFIVHHDRCIVFPGDEAPYPGIADANIMYWGISVIQSVYDQIKNLGAMNQSLANLFMELIVGKYKMADLGAILAEQGGLDKVYQRLEVINASKSLINGVLLGEGEEYSRDSVTLSGVGDVWDRGMIMVAAVSEIPVTRLFGVSPNGLNPTDESSRKNYSDSLESKQETYLYPRVQKLVTLINNGAKILPVGKPLGIRFNPVWKPTQKDLVEMNKTQAESDKVYIENGVLSPDEVRSNRFEGEQSFLTVVEETDAG